MIFFKIVFNLLNRYRQMRELIRVYSIYELLIFFLADDYQFFRFIKLIIRDT